LNITAVIAVAFGGFMRACRRETPPPNPRPQGAGGWIERPLRHLTTAIAVAASLLLAAPAAAADERVRIELNRLEEREESCRVHLVLENGSASGFVGYKLDLVLFGPDGIIARRIAVDVAPLRARKKSVKLFDVDGLACAGIGSVLVNDVLDCRSAAGESADCVDSLAVSTRADVGFSK
jgi:hypothetical protein